jgi:hypothetical protein
VSSCLKTLGSREITVLAKSGAGIQRWTPWLRFWERFCANAKGVYLTRGESSASYAIICHNIRTYQSAGVVEIVRGRHNAEIALKKFQACQSSADHHQGWRYFFEETDLKAGMDPAKATHLRQADLDMRESRALQEMNALAGPDGTFH